MSEVLKDKHNRRRSVTVAFRVSPEEAELINRLVEASGLTKQDYVTSCLEEHTVSLIPSTRMQRGMMRQMDAVYRELRRIKEASEMSPELAILVERLGEQFLALGAVDAQRPSDTELETLAITGLEREAR